MGEDGFVDFAIGVFGVHGAAGGVGADGAAAVAGGEVTTLEAVFVADEFAGAFDKLATGRAFAEHAGEVGFAEDVAEEVVGVTGDPAVALRDRAFGVDGDELVGAVFFPDAGEPCGATAEVIHQGIERAEGDAVVEAAFDPDVEEIGEELREGGGFELEIVFAFVGGAPGEGRVDLEIGEAEFVDVVSVEGIGAGFEAAAVEDGDDADLDAGFAGLVEAFTPDLGVLLGAAAEEFAVEIWVIHRCADRAVEHLEDEIVPNGGV